MRAAILKDNVVTNIIIIDPDRYTGAAVHTGELPVAIGDTYDGADFYRDGVKVEIPVEEPNTEYADALTIMGVELYEEVEEDAPSEN